MKNLKTQNLGLTDHFRTKGAACGRPHPRNLGQDAVRGDVSRFSRQLERMLQTVRNIKHDMIMLDGQLDEILNQLDKL
jgi:hypothetical protein